MRQRWLVCPNCETVMDLHYDPSQLEVSWYECPICGHHVESDGLRPQDDDAPGGWQREF